MRGASFGRVARPLPTLITLMKALDLDDTVTPCHECDALAYHESRKLVHRFLTMLQFSEFDIKQRIGTLSGGQRARVALAQCLLSGASTLILDEPTNHLDVTTIQVMERALIHFPGRGCCRQPRPSFHRQDCRRGCLSSMGKGGTSIFVGNWTMWHATQE